MGSKSFELIFYPLVLKSRRETFAWISPRTFGETRALLYPVCILLLVLRHKTIRVKASTLFVMHTFLQMLLLSLIIIKYYGGLLAFPLVLLFSLMQLADSLEIPSLCIGPKRKKKPKEG